MSAGPAVVAALRPDRPLLGIATICLGMLLMTGQDALVKWLTQSFPVLQIMFVRSVMMVPMVLILIAATEGLGALRTRRPGAHLLRAAVAFLTFISFFTAVSLMPLADVIAIVFASPLFVTLLSGPLLGETVGWRRWLAVIVGFTGVLVIVGPTGAGAELWPSLVALVSSGLYALWVILTRRLATGESSTVLVFYSAVFFAVASLPSAPFVGWEMPDAGALGLFGLLALLTTLGMTLITQAYRLAPASVVVPFDYTAMIWAVVLGYWIWGDVPGPWVLGGAALVIGSGLFIFRRELTLARRATGN